MRIVIIGAGIGGLSAALALHQAGHEPEIHERREAPGEAAGEGVFLTLAVNGQHALGALGAGELARTIGFQTGEIHFASGRGKLLGTMPLGPTLPDGSSARTIKRADLIAALRELVTARGIPIHFGRSLEAYEETSAAVTARFADGSEATGEVLIGADGIGSRVRSLIDPGAPTPRFSGVLNTGGFARVPGLAWAGGAYTMTWGKQCFFGHTVAPDGEIWWFANPPAKAEPARGELRARTSEDARRELLALLARDAGPAARIVEATAGPIELWAQHDLPTVPRWTSGRALIIGDAAHGVSPTTGQGASLAIEDAVVLGRRLASAASVEAALAGFVAERRGRVEKIAAWGRRVGSTKTAGPIGRRISDVMMPPMLKLGASDAAQRRQSWIFEFSGG